MGFDPVSFAIGKASGGGGGGGGKLQKKTFTSAEIKIMLQRPTPFSIGPDAGYDGLSEIEVVTPATFDLIAESGGITGRAQMGGSTSYFNSKSSTSSTQVMYYRADQNEASGYNVYGEQTSNNTAMFDVAIPAEYKLLSIDIESSGSNGAYNMSVMYIRDAYGVTGYNGGQFAGNGLKTVAFTYYGSTSTQINSQPGVTIDSKTPYSLNRQTVLIDISEFDIDLWIGWHRCDNTTTIHSIIASK